MRDDHVIDEWKVLPGKKIRLHKSDSSWAGCDQVREQSKDQAERLLEHNRSELKTAQSLLYADRRYAILVIFQAMDTAGKDGTIQHVMSGVNPQGCQVFTFKEPTPQEEAHTFLWRYFCCLPERGRIGIFNRSYYEDVIVPRVHPERISPLLDHKKVGKQFWQDRYKDINALEHHLVRNGTIVLKFFLNLSKEEQKTRLLERIDQPEKNWKFSPTDLVERGYWDEYIDAYEHALTETNTQYAPWYIIPADHKWFSRAIIGDILVKTILQLNLKYPTPSKAERKALSKAREQLMSES